MEDVRVDAWLWAVRIFKTRSAATTACRAGHVSVNGSAAKPATRVKVGDRVEARAAQRQRILEVVRVLDKRVGAPVAAEAMVDLSPPPPESDGVPPPAERDRGAGRPTKRDRRAIDKIRRG